MDNIIFSIIHYLQSLSAELLSLILFLTCSVIILAMLRFFGAVGLYAYSTIAIIMANIQVLTVAEFSFSSRPIALGTVVFATTFLVSDILTEHYNKKTAQTALWLSVWGQIVVTIVMVLALGYKPIECNSLPSEVSAVCTTNALAMLKLFSPSPRLLIASLLAYAISQLFDIWVFQKIKDLSHNRWLWLRVNTSTLLSGLLDNTVFSVIAWVILSSTPVDFSTLVFTFILGTYLMRVVISFLSTPIIYLSYYFLPKTETFYEHKF